MLIRDRIRELRRIQASQLRPNAKNWRTHPPEQQDALRGILAEVGYADALVARELPDGTFELIDGHLRAETTPDQLVPVLLLDVTDAEADKLLVSLDPLASLAEADNDKLHALLAEVDTDSEALRKMWQELEIDNPLDDEEPPAAEPAPPPPERGTHWDIRQGDVLEVLRTLPAESVHCVITSPPLLLTDQPIELSTVHPKPLATLNISIRKAEVGNLSRGAVLVGEIAISSDLGSVVGSIFLKRSELQNHMGLPDLDPQERQQQVESLFRLKIAETPAPEGTATVAMWFLFVQMSAEQLRQKLDSRSINHADLNPSMVTGGLSALTSVCFGFLDPDVSFSVDDASCVGQVDVAHGCLVGGVQGL